MSNAWKDLGFKVFTPIHSALYRATGGRVGGRMVKSPVLLLTTRGRKSGKLRTTPLLYLADGDRLVVVASKGGDDRSPLWYLNLQANPVVGVEVGRTSRLMRAETARGEERAELWSKVTHMYPPYDDYQRRTQRVIPVVVLHPYEAPGGGGG